MYVHTYKNILCGMYAYCVLCICIYSVCTQLYYIVWWYREKPLAIYAFSTNKQAQKRLSSSTSSGGFVVNDVMIHFSGMLVCLCVCVYIRMCVYLYLCVYMYVCVLYTSVCMCLCVFTMYVCLVYVYLVYVYICVYMYMCIVCMCVCVLACVVCVRVCVCCMYVCACVSKHACIDMCINVRTSTYSYVCLSTYILHIIIICKIVFLFIGCIFPCISTNTTIWRGR